MLFLQILGPLLGGLALFLYGLDKMTSALKAVAGSRLQSGLGKLTANRLLGVVAGAGVTALLNSSTITTVLMVGFVSAGIMTLDQAVPMIMGANIGSTFTAQLVAFQVSALIYYMLAFGFLLNIITKKDLVRQLGLGILGLGLLFLGIELMGDATHPLRTHEPFITAMKEMRHPLIGVAIGAIFTAVVQSSAATLALVITLGSQGIMPLEAGIAIILGANVGTCGTALLASIGKKAEAVQVGLVHLMFNIFGVLFFIFIIPQFAELVRNVSPSYSELEGISRLAAETPRQVANAHTIFSVASTLVLVWFAGPMASLARILAPSKSEPVETPLSSPRYLDDTTFDVPAFAISRVQLELMRMGECVIAIIRGSSNVAIGSDRALMSDLEKDSASLDELASAILRFIGHLFETDLSDKERQQLIDITQIVASLDGIREVAALNLSSFRERRDLSKIDLSSLPSSDAQHFQVAVLDCLERAVAIIGTANQTEASRIIAAKSEIEALAAKTRQSVFEGLNLNNPQHLQSFRFANGLIEHFNEIARRTRAVAKATRDLTPASTTEDIQP